MPTHRTTPRILRLREGPGTDRIIIERLPVGTDVDVLAGPDQNGWAQVAAHLLNGVVKGWVKAEFIILTNEAEPDWLQIAKGEIGVAEFPGSQHHPRILEYHQHTTYKATTDEVPWCSSFVNWCISQAGRIGTNSAAAISWEGWGVELPAPRVGCVVVLKRYDRNNPDAAHVSFFVRKRGAMIDLLGGNQGNSVREQGYSINDVITYRWPNT